MRGLGLACTAVLFVHAASAAEDAAKIPKIFGGAALQEIYRVRLDKGDLLLESIKDIIRTYEIHDGAVLTGVGQLAECTFHAAGSPNIAVREPVQLGGLNGLIADGEPHLHAALSNPARGGFTGHLEKGCIVLNHVELTIMKFSGIPLARKKVKGAGGVLQRK